MECNGNNIKKKANKSFGNAAFLYQSEATCLKRNKQVLFKNVKLKRSKAK
jgi:hypothetical protein